MAANGTLGRRLNASVLLLLALVMVLGAGSLWVSWNLGSQLDSAINNLGSQQMLAGRISAGAAELVGAERALATATLLQQQDRTGKAQADFSATEARVQRAFDEFLKLQLAADIRTSFERLRSDLSSAEEMHRRLVGHLGRQEMDQGLQLLDSSLLPRLQLVSEGAKSLVDRQAQRMRLVSASAATTQKISVAVAAALTLISFVVGALTFIGVRQATTRLRGISGRLANCAEQVSLGSEQINSSSRLLAEGASKQAGSLQETSASSQEMSALTQHNADSTRQAASLMAQVSQEVGAANRTLGEMADSMKEIKVSSEKIARIIKVIDDISFQTNILALNAAVEAARAGEAGMGFAVVADEVRNLAGRCATAARDTAELIEDSIKSSSAGAEKLGMMADAISRITRSAESVKGIIEAVNSGSQEQARGISLVAGALNQIERVTQQTAASSEESASASESMRSQADTMLAVVRDLVTLVGEGDDVGRRHELAV